jgi:hypothetical protein
VLLPESWTERLPFLGALEDDWHPVPRYALIAWSIFYAFFFYELLSGGAFPNYMNGVFVPVHEGGHLIFEWFGQFIAVAGGTFLQLAAPAMLSIYFAFRRQPQGVTFCLFFMFQQFSPIAMYMADARAQELPLLTVGSGDNVIHDWNYLFDRLGLLAHDTQIASAMRVIGWFGMLATVAWFVWRGLTQRTAIPARREWE